MRKQGYSIKDIASAVGVSKGSASLWCQDIVLTKAQKTNLKEKQNAAGLKGRLLGAQMNKDKRTKAISDANVYGVDSIGTLTKRDLFLLGIGLYWGEGIKSRTGQTAIINSDPYLLQIGKRWFLECMNVTKAELRPYIYLSEQHRDRENVIVAYWVKQLAIPKNQFLAPIYIQQKPKKTYKNHNEYFGVVALRVCRSTNLKYQIQGLINACTTRTRIS